VKDILFNSSVSVNVENDLFGLSFTKVLNFLNLMKKKKKKKKKKKNT